MQGAHCIWCVRAGELRDYVVAHGDAHVGFREQDDAELARWAAKQRKDRKSGDLAPDRCGQPPTCLLQGKHSVV